MISRLIGTKKIVATVWRWGYYFFVPMYVKNARINITPSKKSLNSSIISSNDIIPPPIKEIFGVTSRLYKLIGDLSI